MKKLLNRETVLYLIFGVLTTAVNYVLFWLGIRLFGVDATLAVNVGCFLAAASFAYVTNKLFVFESKSWAGAVLRREIPAFFSARVFSFLMEEAGLWISMDLLHLDEVDLALRLLGRDLTLNGVEIAKVVLSVAVVALNYVFSKLWIFKKGRDSHKD